MEAKVSKSTPEVPTTRDAARAAILGAKQVKSETISFFGTDIEVRQPTLGQILELQAKSSGDATAFAINILLNHVYLPGTNEHVFEAANTDELKEMPFGPDFNTLVQAYQRLTGTGPDNDPLVKKQPTEDSNETD
jgi:hypothetical protein